MGPLEGWVFRVLVSGDTWNGVSSWFEMLMLSRCRSDDLPQNVQIAVEELINLMTILYVAIQEALDDPEGLIEVRKRLRMSPVHLVQVIAVNVCQS